MDGDAKLPPTVQGVNKKNLPQDVAMFEWGYNVKRATSSFLWAILGVRSATICPT